MTFSARNIKVALETAYSKTHILVMLLVACLFIWIGIYVYRNYVGSYLGSHIEGYAANMGDDAPDPNGKTATLYMFGTSWCPHCKTAKPMFKDFMGTGIIQVNGMPVRLRMVEEKEIKKGVDPEIKGYPSFLYTDSAGKTVEFDGPRTPDGFMEFLKTKILS